MVRSILCTFSVTSLTDDMANAVAVSAFMQSSRSFLYSVHRTANLFGSADIRDAGGSSDRCNVRHAVHCFARYPARRSLVAERRPKVAAGIYEKYT